MSTISLHRYIERINKLLDDNRIDDAAIHCRHILQQYPRHVATYRILAQALLEQGDRGGATDLFQRVLSTDPNDFIAHLGLAIIHEEASDLPQAIWHMERAYEIKPYDPTVQEKLKELYRYNKMPVPRTLQLTRGALARHYMHGELYQLAVSELRDALAQEKDRVDLEVLLAEALWRDDLRVDAVEVCHNVLERLPNCIPVNAILAEIWLLTGRVSEANENLGRLQQLTQVDASSVDLETLVGRAFTANGRQYLPEKVEIEYLEDLTDRVSDVEISAEWVDDATSAEDAESVDSEGMFGWLRDGAFSEEAASLEEIASADTDEEMISADSLWLVDKTDQSLEQQTGISDNVSEWLQELDTAANPETPRLTAEGNDEISADLDAASHWLTEASDTDEDQIEAEPPVLESEWFSAERVEEQALVEDDSTSDEDSEWLAMLDQVDSDATQPFDMPELAMSDLADEDPGEILPDWLFGDDLDVPVQANDDTVLLDELPSAEAESSAIEETDEEDGIPEWLLSGELDEADDLGPEDATQELTADKPEAEPDEPSDEVAGAADQSPHFEQASEFPAASLTEIQPSAAEIPDWLLGEQYLPKSEAEVVDELEIEPERPTIESTQPETDVSDWLSSDDLGEDAATEATAEPIDDVDDLADIPSQADADVEEWPSDADLESWAETQLEVDEFLEVPGLATDVDSKLDGDILSWLSEDVLDSEKGVEETTEESLDELEMPVVDAGLLATDTQAWSDDADLKPKAETEAEAEHEDRPESVAGVTRKLDDDLLDRLSEDSLDLEEEAEAAEKSFDELEMPVVDTSFLATDALAWSDDADLEPEAEREASMEPLDETESAIDAIGMAADDMMLSEVDVDHLTGWLFDKPEDDLEEPNVAELARDVGPAHLSERPTTPSEEVTAEWEKFPADEPAEPSDAELADAEPADEENLDWMTMVVPEEPDDMGAAGTEVHDAWQAEWLDEHDDQAAEIGSETTLDEYSEDEEQVIAESTLLPEDGDVLPEEILPAELLREELDLMVELDSLGEQQAESEDLDDSDDAIAEEVGTTPMDEDLAWLSMQDEEPTEPDLSSSRPIESDAPLGTRAAADDEGEPVVQDDIARETPEDLDEAMAWLEELAADQRAPVEELPSVADLIESEWDIAAEPEQSDAVTEQELEEAEADLAELMADESAGMDEAMTWLSEIEVEAEPADEVELIEPAEAEVEEVDEVEPDMVAEAEHEEFEVTASQAQEAVAEVGLDELMADESAGMDEAMTWLSEIEAEVKWPEAEPADEADLIELAEAEVEEVDEVEPDTVAEPEYEESEVTSSQAEEAEAEVDLTELMADESAGMDEAMTWLSEIEAEVELADEADLIEPAEAEIEPVELEATTEPGYEEPEVGTLEAEAEVELAEVFADEIAEMDEAVPSLSESEAEAGAEPEAALEPDVEEPEAEEIKLEDFEPDLDDLLAEASFASDEDMAWLEELEDEAELPEAELADIGELVDIPTIGEPEETGAIEAETEPEVEMEAEVESVADLPGDDVLGALADVPEDLDDAMAWLEELAARQGAPVEELPSIADVTKPETEMTAKPEVAPAVESETTHIPETAPAMLSDDADVEIEEAPEDLDEVMVWSEEPTALWEESPAVADVTDVEAVDRLEQEAAPAVEAELEDEIALEEETLTDAEDVLADVAEDLDETMAWLDEFAAERDEPEEVPAATEPIAHVHEPEADLELETLSTALADAPDELDAALDWLEQNVLDESDDALSDEIPLPAVDDVDVDDDELDEALDWLEQLALTDTAPLVEPAPTPTAEPEALEEVGPALEEETAAEKDDDESHLLWIEKEPDAVPDISWDDAEVPIDRPETEEVPLTETLEMGYEEADLLAGLPDDTDNALAWVDQLVAEQSVFDAELEDASSYLDESESEVSVVQKPISTVEEESLDEESDADALPTELDIQPTFGGDDDALFTPSVGVSEGELEDGFLDDVPDDPEAALAWLEQFVEADEESVAEASQVEVDSEPLGERPASVTAESVVEPEVKADESTEDALPVSDELWIQSTFGGDDDALYTPSVSVSEGELEDGFLDDVPDDPEAALVWLEQFVEIDEPESRQQEAQEVEPSEETPSLAVADLVSEMLGEIADDVEADLLANIPDDPDEAIAWLQQFVDEDARESDSSKGRTRVATDEIASANTDELIASVPIQRPEGDEDDLEADLLAGIPDDPDAAMEWLQNLAAEQDEELVESPTAGFTEETEVEEISTSDLIEEVTLSVSEDERLMEDVADQLDEDLTDSMPEWFQMDSDDTGSLRETGWLRSLPEPDVAGWLEAEEEATVSGIYDFSEVMTQMGTQYETGPLPEVEAFPEPEEDALILTETDRFESAIQIDESQMTLARETLSVGDYDEAAKAYQSLIETGEGLNTLIAELETVANQYQHQPELRRLLGDAYTRNGQLQKALDTYRAALDQL